VLFGEHPVHSIIGRWFKRPRGMMEIRIFVVPLRPIAQPEGMRFRMIVECALEDSATELVAFTMARINLLLPSSCSFVGQLIALRHRMRVQQGSLRMWPLRFRSNFPLSLWLDRCASRSC
jgi:hypothetical protein